MAQEFLTVSRKRKYCKVCKMNFGTDKGLFRHVRNHHESDARASDTRPARHGTSRSIGKRAKSGNGEWEGAQ